MKYVIAITLIAAAYLGHYLWKRQSHRLDDLMAMEARQSKQLQNLQSQLLNEHKNEAAGLQIELDAERTVLNDLAIQLEREKNNLRVLQSKRQDFTGVVAPVSADDQSNLRLQHDNLDSYNSQMSKDQQALQQLRAESKKAHDLEASNKKLRDQSRSQRIHDDQNYLRQSSDLLLVLKKDKKNPGTDLQIQELNNRRTQAQAEIQTLQE
jgi:hypothetical protein